MLDTKLIQPALYRLPATTEPTGMLTDCNESVLEDCYSGNIWRCSIFVNQAFQRVGGGKGGQAGKNMSTIIVTVCISAASAHGLWCLFTNRTFCN